MVQISGLCCSLSSLINISLIILFRGLATLGNAGLFIDIADFISFLGFCSLEYAEWHVCS